MEIIYHKYDIPKHIAEDIIHQCNTISIDTETMGLNLQRDRLCVIQISAKNKVYIIHFPNAEYSTSENIKSVFMVDKIQKVFHYGRFDIAVIYKHFGVLCKNVFCTKIASYISRTYTNHHSLKTLCRDILNKQISKTQQQSDWGSKEITHAQLEYAANDVIYLEDIMNHFIKTIERENRMNILEPTLEYLPYRAMYDALGWDQIDFFSFMRMNDQKAPV